MLQVPPFRKLFFVLLLSSVPLNLYAVAIGDTETIKQPKGEPEIIEQPKIEMPKFEMPKLDPPETTIQFDSTDMSGRHSRVQLGLGLKLSRVSVEDSIGETNKLHSAQAFSVYFTNRVSNAFAKYFSMPALLNVRYLSELYVGSYAFEADTRHVGQQVTQLGFRFTLQKKVFFAKNIDPLFGMGLDVTNSNFQKRHDVDSEGFLTNEYANKSSPGVGLTFNIMKTWTNISDMDIASKLEYTLPMGSELSHVSLGIILFFKNGSGHSSFSDLKPIN